MYKVFTGQFSRGFSVASIHEARRAVRGWHGWQITDASGDRLFWNDRGVLHSIMEEKSDA